MDITRRLVTAARGNGEPRPAVALYMDAKTREQVQRDLDVGLGDQLAHYINHHVLPGHQRQGHQQGGEELAGHVAAHADGGVKRQLGCADTQRRVTILAGVADVAADLAQGIHQVTNRALVHTRHAVQREVTAQHSQCRGQRADGGARVAHEQVGLVYSQLTGQTINLGGAALLAHTTAQLAQRVEHDVGVVRVQQVVYPGCAVAQCGQQQHPVGDTFGAGQGDGATGRSQRGDIQKGGAEHGKKAFSASACVSSCASPHAMCWPGRWIVQAPARRRW